jgi:serine protease AprX
VEQLKRIQVFAVAVLLSSCGESLVSINEVPFEDQVSAEGPLLLSDAQMLRVPGTDQTFAVWENRGAFSLKDGARDFGPAKRTQFTLAFRGDVHDPRAASVDVGAGLYVVQFFAPPARGFLEELAASGAEALHPFPHLGYVMRLSEDALKAASKAPYVRAIEPYTPSRKLAIAGFDLSVARSYRLVPARQNSEVRGLLAARLIELGAEVESVTGYALEASLTRDQLLTVAEWDDVLHVEPWTAFESDTNLARVISGANFVETTLGFTGQGVRAEVMDGNVDATHPDLKNRGILFHGSHSGDASHGTPTTGIVFGDGTANPTARGFMPLGQPIFADYETLANNRYEHTAELRTAPYQAVLQSNSWGSARTTQYTAVSAELDRIVFELDFLIFNSQSNAGTRDSRPEAWAKNVVSIGGVNHYNTLDTADDRWAGGGSIGPASDGRIKPDLAHFWDETIAPAQGGGYTEFGGTSGATPITAGAAGLMMQMWSAGLFGNPASGATVFENRPHFSTAKALLINTATQWNFSGETADLTRVHQGWGRVDLERLYGLRNSLFIINETDVLTQSQARTYQLAVAAGTPELRATLTWADPPALPSAGVHRVNDLTLKVTAPDGTITFGNNGLLASTFSTPGGTANSIDTVENVFVANPAVGTWTIEVRADLVAQDGHVETPAVDADYALIVSGVQRSATATPPTVRLTEPLEGASVSGIITISATAADADGTVRRVRFGLPNGSAFDDETAPYSITFDTTTVTNGPAQLSAIAFDNEELASTVAFAGITITNADAGVDGGVLVDGGVDAGVDAGVVDGGTTPIDAGVDGGLPQTDGGVDGGMTPDAGSPLVISHLFGGGGASGRYASDFVELHNTSAAPFVMAGYSLQYASSRGSFWSRVNLPATTIPAGGHYLVSLGSVSSSGQPLPTPDLRSTAINLSSTAGKLALMPTQTNLQPTACPSGAVDLVGYGVTTNCALGSTAPGLTSRSSLLRGAAGCANSGNNRADFALTSTVAPLGLAAPTNVCR